MYKKYFISLIIFFLANISYGQDPVMESVRHEESNPNKDYFISQLIQNKSMDYNSRTNLLFESPCWEQGVLDTTFCVLLFNYYLSNTRPEDISEGLAYRLYDFFAKNPNGILQLNNFINLMDKTDQKRLFENILLDLLYETILRNEQTDYEPKLAEIDFFRIFPYFFSDDNFIRIHNLLESYYEGKGM